MPGRKGQRPCAVGAAIGLLSVIASANAGVRSPSAASGARSCRLRLSARRRTAQAAVRGVDGRRGAAAGGGPDRIPGRRPAGAAACGVQAPEVAGERRVAPAVAALAKLAEQAAAVAVAAGPALDQQGTQVDQAAPRIAAPLALGEGLAPQVPVDGQRAMPSCRAMAWPGQPRRWSAQICPCRASRRSRRSAAKVDARAGDRDGATGAGPPKAHHIDGQRTGLVTGPPGRPIRRDAARGSFNDLERKRCTLKLHYDGWLALPAALRLELGLDKEAVLELELVDGTIVLRPSGGGGDQPPCVRRRPSLPSLSHSRLLFAAGRHADHGEGDRARKGPDPARSGHATERPRGRPRKAEVEPGPAPASVPVPAPLWELRRKADRPVVVAGGDDPVSVPDRRPVRLAWERVHGHEPEERRPFRNVEVRKLGPGRGHDKPRASRSRLQLPGQRTG